MDFMVLLKAHIWADGAFVEAAPWAALKATDLQPDRNPARKTAGFHN